jgi:hypothetical protein
MSYEWVHEGCKKGDIVAIGLTGESHGCRLEDAIFLGSATVPREK